MLVLCCINSVKSTGSVNEDMVQNAISYDRYFQPPVSSSIRIASSNKAEGKKVRCILNKYFDPQLDTYYHFVIRCMINLIF